MQILLKFILGKDYKNIVKTLTEEEICCIVDGFAKKNMRSPQTIRDVLEYLYCHKKAFGDIIETMDVAENIVRNMKKNIDYFAFLNRFHVGEFSLKEGQVKMNFLNTISSLFERKRKMERASVLRHEIDHCATSKTNPKTGRKEGCGIDINSMQYYVFKSFGKFDERTKVLLEDGLHCLDEGITVFKQNKYDIIKNGYGMKHSQFYQIYLGVAEHLARMIGEENMIKLQYEGNYKVMREIYGEKTGLDLNKLVYFLGIIYDKAHAQVQEEELSRLRREAYNDGKEMLRVLKNVEDELEREKEEK